MRLRTLLAAAVLAAAALAAPGLVAPALAQDRAATGARVAAACSACHGADGISRIPGTPSLAGQQAGFITVQLILIREGIRQIPVMRPVVMGLSDPEIEAVAAHFAAMPPAPPADRRPRDPALFAAGQALIGPRNCNVCHLPSLVGRDQVPRIIGQREEVLARFMTEYRDGRRSGPDPQMNGAVFGLSDADIAALAHYLAQRE